MSEYLFWLETASGEYLEWRGLTRTAARAMYLNTERRSPTNAASYGWAHHDNYWHKSHGPRA